MIGSNWRTIPLGTLFTHRNEPVRSGDVAALSVTRNGVVDQLDSVATSVDGTPKKLVHEGDIVINSRSDRKGSAGLSPRMGSVSVINTVLKPRTIHPRFAHHLLRSTWFQEEFYRFGSGIVADLWSTRWAAMKGIQLQVPDSRTQVEIASYLDHETADIDILTSELEHLRTLGHERLSTRTSALIWDQGFPRAKIKHIADILPGFPFSSSQYTTTSSSSSVRLL